MSRLKKVVRNIIVLIILFFLFIMGSGLYLSPLSAYRNSERSLHYGPSEVVHIEDFEGSKYILGKYDKWFSCNPVNRHLLFLWSIGSGSHGYEIDKSKAVNYSWGMSRELYRVYGIINDDKITKVEVTLHNGNVLTQTEFYDGMFLITWKASNTQYRDWDLKSIKAYDYSDNIIFEYSY